MVDPAGRKTCDPTVQDFIRRPFINYLNISQSAGMVVTRLYNWRVVELEAHPRVDAIVQDNTSNRQLRLELVYITPLVQQKSSLKRKIDSTRRRIDDKSLDGLLVMTLIRKVKDDIDKGFITLKGYCLLGYYVSSDQIKEIKTDDLSERIVEGMNELMETDEEYISHVNALVLATDEKVERNIEKLDQISAEQKHNNKKLNQISAEQEHNNKKLDQISDNQKKINEDLTEIKDMLRKISKS